MYKIEAKKVVYNFLTHEISLCYTGAKGEILFDSKGEFACYRVLEELKLPIQVHKYIPQLDWHIDFTVNFLYPHAILPVLQNLGYTLYSGKYLYFEYKGVIDESFIDRYKRLPMLLQQNLVIVTKGPETITYFDKLRNAKITKPTLSIGKLRHLIKEL